MKNHFLYPSGILQHNLITKSNHFKQDKIESYDIEKEWIDPMTSFFLIYFLILLEYILNFLRRKCIIGKFSEIFMSDYVFTLPSQKLIL